MKAHRAAVVMAGAGILLGACGDDLLGPSDPITELPRALTAVEAALITESNTFGFELLGEVVSNDDRPNVVLSPLSASMALGMTLNGADGTTFDAMRETLGFDGMSQAEINEAYRGLITLLTELDPAVQFDIANSIWANENVTVLDSFLDAVRDAFNAQTESRDFSDSATLDAINEWVSEQTDGSIDSILESLDPALVMLLINAIYFDGAWTTQFDEDDTSRRDFFREDGSTVSVDMMNISDVELPLGGGPGYQAVELPYGGGAFSMLVVVPGEEPRDFAASLDDAMWTNIVSGLSPVEVDGVSIPKFELSYDVFLNDALREMGMDVAFKPGADFTRMSPIGNQLCIDFVRQKTFIQVDERGTKAAAVTAVGIGPTSFIGLFADRPFVFAIRERLSGTILFTGYVSDPTAEDPGPEPFEKTCG
ncbi:MAG: serpin family protein [Gemmatimonadota bacterium]